jgi:hypothetical protein
MQGPGLHGAHCAVLISGGPLNAVGCGVISADLMLLSVGMALTRLRWCGEALNRDAGHAESRRQGERVESERKNQPR